MKAIDTEYKGYLFRSRLEARWAVYFDVLGINWQYEIEGFEQDGIRYLPDFYFPKYKIWGEVKPEGHKNKDLKKWLMFTEKHSLIIFEGNPHATKCKYYQGEGVTFDVIPFAFLIKQSHGMFWNCTGKENFGNIEPFATAIKTSNHKRF